MLGCSPLLKIISQSFNAFLSHNNLTTFQSITFLTFQIAFLSYFPQWLAQIHKGRQGQRRELSLHQCFLAGIHLSKLVCFLQSWSYKAWQ